MNEEALNLLKSLLALPPETLTQEQQAIIKGRATYLTPEELARYPFLKGVKVERQLPKDVYQPQVVVKEEIRVDEIVTAQSAMSDPKRQERLADRKFMEQGGADPDNNPQTEAAETQQEKLAEQKTPEKPAEEKVA